MSRKRKTPEKIQGKKVRSAFEYEVWKGIQAFLPNKKAKAYYEPEKLTYTVTSEYIPDFVIERKDGTKMYIEAKGLGRAFDYQTRKKMIAIKEQYPYLDIRIVFYKDGPISKGAKMRASDWATKYNYKFSIGTVPKEWFDND